MSRGEIRLDEAHVEAGRVNRAEVLGTFCALFRRQLPLPVRRACAAPGVRPSASDPIGDTRHDRYATDDQDEPRRRGDDEGKNDESNA